MSGPATAVLAFTVTLGAVWASRPVAMRIGAVSVVREGRWHSHASVPRLAGPGILLGLTVAVDLRTALALAPFCLVGVLDDLRELSPGPKAVLLVLASLAAGLLVDSVLVAATAWVVANAVNLLDHADGVAGSAVAVSLVMVGTPAMTAAGAAVLGFLLLNLPPARTFLGDGGSLMLGALLVLAWHQQGPGSVAFAAAVPLLDAGFVVVRRIAARRPPWVGGTDHTGHVLLRAGVPAGVLPVLYAAAAAAAVVLGEEWA